MVREKAELSNLSRIRHNVVGIIEKLGVKLDQAAKDDVMLAVGEAVANIILHGECSEIGLAVAVLSDSVIVTLEAECYSDPDEVRSWFGRESDLSIESGRGDEIVMALCGVDFHKGSIDLVFSLASKVRLAEPEMAMA